MKHPRQFRVNITDFGAVGDGWNDDSAAFLAAIHSLFEFICVPKGNWIIHDAVEKLMSEDRFITCKGTRCACQKRRKLKSMI